VARCVSVCAVTESSYTPSSTVGNIVAARPILAGLFEHVGIDYCCGGKQTLTQACVAQGLDAVTFARLLEAMAKLTLTGTVIDVSGMSLTALADHIEQTHHRYLKGELPALVEKAERVAKKHSWRDPRLLPVAATMQALAVDMHQHMEKEEFILFPLVRELERSGATSGHCGSIANPIRQMEREHDGAGAAVARLRELTNGFVPDGDACNTHRAMLAGFAQLESDLHQHVHKENNVLFLRALALETTRWPGRFAASATGVLNADCSPA
jgi:regulator of cell morphogenesis and NO signaling